MGDVRMPMKALELNSVILDIKSIVAQDPTTVKRIGVFGSLARGETHENSDIDIAIEYEHDPNKTINFAHFTKFIKMCEQLEDILSGQYGRKIDVIPVEERENCLLQDIREEIIWV